MVYSLWCIAFFHYDIGNYLPGMLGLALVGAGVRLPKIMTATQRGWKLWARRTVLVSCGAALAAMVALVLAVAVYENHVPSGGHDAVIVLGGGLVGDEKPQGFRARVYAAVEYLEANPEAIAVVSGRQGARDNISAAYAMRRHMILQGMPPERIIMEERAGSTLENFMFSKQLLDAHFHGYEYSVLYVSNAFHLPRARMLAAYVGLRGEGLAAPSQPYMLPNYLSREYLAFAWAILSMIYRTNS